MPASFIPLFLVVTAASFGFHCARASAIIRRQHNKKQVTITQVDDNGRFSAESGDIPEIFYGYKCKLISTASFLEASAIKLDPPSSGSYQFASQHADMSYSQWNQDIILAPILNQIKNGFFVESGARDGEEHSNTIYFETRGWQGLLIEPGAEYSNLPQKHRKAYGFHGALSPTKSSERLHFHDSVDGLSHISQSDGFEVQAEPLEKLLEAIDPDRKTVDFWSLDIEGSEAAVLEATDFNKIKMGVLIIEMNKTPENNRRISAVMKENGFEDIGKTKYDGGFLDHVFVNPRYFQDLGLTIPGHVDGLY